MSKILVTGGAGFIASELTSQLVEAGHDVTVIDKLTYAGDKANLSSVMHKISFHECDISSVYVHELVSDSSFDTIYHAAAESHVDRSISSYVPFIHTNVTGTYNLLDAAISCAPHPRFIYISTDEVYGSVDVGACTETAPLNPSNAYAATKMSAEHAVSAYANTYRLPIIITRSCNNFGPRQHPEKLVPMLIRAGLSSTDATIHGYGSSIREWIYVEDNAAAIIYAAEKGTPGETYNISTGIHRDCLQMLAAVESHLATSISTALVKNRPGNDHRYAMDSTKLRSLGWLPQYTFARALSDTIKWYRERYHADKAS